MNRFIKLLFTTLLILLTPTSILAELLDSWDNEEAYKPTPILFLHGFARGSPNSWSGLASYLSQYYQPYQDIGPVLSNSSSYLERIDFQDPNGSIDRYDPGEFNPQGNSAGWADKAGLAIDAMLSGDNYGSYSNKAILIAHSMGGLAAREYITTVGSGNVAKLITIDTPHAGTPLANIAQGVNKSRSVGWKTPLIGWIYTADVAAVDAAFNILGNIDLDGEAAEDTAVGSEFLTGLNMRFQPDIPSDAISAYDWAIRNWLAFHPYYPNSRTDLAPENAGDAIIPIDSQEGFDVITNLGEVRQIWQFNEIERIQGGHSTGLSNASIENPTSGEGESTDVFPDTVFEQILYWIDSEPPEVEITGVTVWNRVREEYEDVPFENGAYQLTTGCCYIEGIVRKEYLPAHTRVDISRQKEGGDEERSFFGYVQADDMWDQNNPESVVGGFRTEVNFHRAEIGDRYTLKIKAINPTNKESNEETIYVEIKDVDLEIVAIDIGDFITRFRVLWRGGNFRDYAPYLRYIDEDGIIRVAYIYDRYSGRSTTFRTIYISDEEVWLEMSSVNFLGIIVGVNRCNIVTERRINKACIFKAIHAGIHRFGMASRTAWEEDNLASEAYAEFLGDTPEVTVGNEPRNCRLHAGISAEKGWSSAPFWAWAKQDSQRWYIDFGNLLPLTGYTINSVYLKGAYSGHGNTVLQINGGREEEEIQFGFSIYKSNSGTWPPQWDSGDQIVYTVANVPGVGADGSSINIDIDVSINPSIITVGTNNIWEIKLGIDQMANYIPRVNYPDSGRTSMWATFGFRIIIDYMPN